MPNRISAVLGVSETAFAQTGAFDAFVDIDSKFHVDPHLLDASNAPELQSARKRFERKFGQVRKLLLHSKRRGDPFWRAARDLIVSRENSHTGLGYAKSHTGGSGIGEELASELADLAKQIIDAGVQDLEIFELIGLFQPDVGADRISDLTVATILPNLLDYSVRVAKELGVATTTVVHDDQKFQIPADRSTGRALILVPKDILRRLPVANSWSEIDYVAAHNAQLRKRVNPIIGATWKKATSQRVGKEKLKDAVLSNKELLEELVDRYKKKPKNAYDFEKDPEAAFAWHGLTQALAFAQPLALQIKGPIDPKGLTEVVEAICTNFKRLVEQNRLSRLFYNDDGSPRKEKVAQLAFYGLADAYCEANDFDISPESDGGSGPVDFKISSGYKFRVTVEMKLSSNPNLLHGFEVQLPTYQRAERAYHSVYLVVQNGQHDNRVRKLLEFRDKALNLGKRVPEIVVVDARPQKSASKRKK